MKNLIIIITILSLFACNEQNEDQFTIDVDVRGKYSGYLYLITTEKLDSSLITNGKSKFSGSVDFPTKAGLITDTISGYDKDFYLENTDIEMEIDITKKDFGNGPTDWILINNVTGTETSRLRKNFENYQISNSGKENWSKKLYDKLENLISENPNNRYVGDLLAEISSDSVLSKNQLSTLYQKLNQKTQDPFAIKKLEQKIYPERTLDIGDQVLDISGHNYSGKSISTKDYRGEFLLIDFWASWCKPCIDQFPKLNSWIEKFSDKDLIVVGVSLEKDQKKWKNTIKKYDLSWPNIFSDEDLAGKLSRKYGINSIPFNVLIDKGGRILMKNVNEDQLKDVLNKS